MVDGDLGCSDSIDQGLPGLVREDTSGFSVHFHDYDDGLELVFVLGSNVPEHLGGVFTRVEGVENSGLYDLHIRSPYPVRPLSVRLLR